MRGQPEWVDQADLREAVLEHRRDLAHKMFGGSPGRFRTVEEADAWMEHQSRLHHWSDPVRDEFQVMTFGQPQPVTFLSTPLTASGLYIGNDVFNVTWESKGVFKIDTTP